MPSHEWPMEHEEHVVRVILVCSAVKEPASHVRQLPWADLPWYLLSAPQLEHADLPPWA